MCPLCRIGICSLEINRIKSLLQFLFFSAFFISDLLLWEDCPSLELIGVEVCCKWRQLFLIHQSFTRRLNKHTHTVLIHVQSGHFCYWRVNEMQYHYSFIIVSCKVKSYLSGGMISRSLQPAEIGHESIKVHRHGV